MRTRASGATIQAESLVIAQETMSTDVSAARGLLDREDLLERLDRAVAKRVTVISAPPGSGKTSLLRAWAERAAGLRRVALVSVERDQQRAQPFWDGVVDAIATGSGVPSALIIPPATTPTASPTLSVTATTRPPMALLMPAARGGQTGDGARCTPAAQAWVSGHPKRVHSPVPVRAEDTHVSWAASIRHPTDICRTFRATRIRAGSPLPFARRTR